MKIIKDNEELELVDGDTFIVANKDEAIDGLNNLKSKEIELKDKDGNKCSTQWSPFEKETDYVAPSKKDFMFNYRVENLIELLEVLKSEGVTILGEMETYDYGKFGWILDNDGNKIELWEPIDRAFE